MLKRSVIVLGQEYVSTANEPNAQLNDLNDIYLLLLSTTTQTVYYPVVLAYYNNHFTLLVMIETQSSISTTSDSSSSLYLYLALSYLSSSTLLLRDLPIHYLNYVEEHNINNLSKKYLTIEDIETEEENIVKCCVLSEDTLPKHVNVLND
ncbi:unnamed protein product [Didymodactylos carnosus]|uniref:Uncharacterized protein n=1 Tax=Didymodactylos carnosus TaxID=1234261 RepID=A0A814F5K8_9BILA|nr:unnamed protein product [Didymodactylos carnosus]CAF3749039.1 unnamed protein product [Didymodactylos carnosus]